MLRFVYLLIIYTTTNYYYFTTMKIRLLLLLLSLSSYCFSQEICNNGIDDDGDGKIDLNDTECLCNATPIPSIIPNASFEDFTSCPGTFSELSLSTGWIQATDATTDYMNTCGFVFPSVSDLSDSLLQFPNGNGIAGAIFGLDYKEYLGCCLSSPMLSGTNYQLTFNIGALPITGDGQTCNGSVVEFEGVNVTIYGTRNCVNLPLSTYTHPTATSTEWFVLGSAFYTPETRWGQLTISFTPTADIKAIMIGAPESLPLSYEMGTCYPYFLFDNLTLNESALFGVNVVQAGTFCNNNLVLSANPSITLTPTATFQWYKEGVAIPGATFATFPVAATPANITRFTVKITDGENCFIAPEYTINASTPAPQIRTVQPDCFAPTGTITVTTQSDFYSFDNGATWVTNNVSGPLLPGRYYVKTKTTSGCVSVSNAVNLTDSSIVNYIDYTFTNPGCATDGSITITSPGSQFSFDAGLTWSTNNTANVPFGNYHIKIKDVSGCVTGENYVFLPEFFLDYPWVTSVQPECNVGGSITVSTPAESYSFDDGATWGNSPTATNLAPGVYLVKIKNAAGCTSSAYYEYLNESFSEAPAVTYTPITCASTGTISIQTPAAEYTFDGGLTWGTNPVKTDVTEGYYDIGVKNELGCRSYGIGMYMYEELLPMPDVVLVQPSCGVGGSVTVVTVADEYSFDGGYTWTTNPVISDLTDYQFYEIRTRNAQGCLSNSNYQGIYPDSNIPQAPYADVIQPSSCTAPTGTITINSWANMYSFDDGVTWTTNNVASNLAAGEYKIKVKGLSECGSPATIIVINALLTAPTPPSIVITDPDCTNASGTVTVNDPAPYYSYDNGISWVDYNSAMLLPGTYLIKVRNAAGCESAATTAVIQSDTGPAALPVFQVAQPNCFLEAGIITITSTAAAYSFDNGQNWGTENISSPLLNGAYLIKIRTAAGCESDAVRIVITPEIIPLPALRNLVYCRYIAASPLIATGNELLWYTTDTGGTGSPTAPVPSTDDLGLTIYYVTQTVNGCESERAAISVRIIDNLLPPIVPDTFYYCQDEPTVMLHADGANLLWYATEFGGTGSATAPTPASNVAGSFYYYVSQSGGSCESNRAKITVVIKPTPEGPVTETHVIYKHHVPTERLTAQGMNLTWYDQDKVLLDFAPKPSSEIIGSETYYVKQTVDGCEGVLLKIVVDIIPNYIDITYPQYFTPNGDGTNESWNIFTPPFNIKATVTIYDRYGKFITQLAAPGKGWDGALNGFNLPATDYWFSVFYTEYGVGKEFKSHFSLVR